MPKICFTISPICRIDVESICLIYLIDYNHSQKKYVRTKISIMGNSSNMKVC